MSLYRIEVTPLPLIISELTTHRRTASLLLIREPVRKTLHWVAGELVLAITDSIHESLGAYLFRRGVVAQAEALHLTPQDWTESVPLFHDERFARIEHKDELLRQWLSGLVLPLFSYVEGTAIITDEEPLPRDRRVPLRGGVGLIVEGIRSIRNGLVIRRCLGDLDRVMEPGKSPLADPGDLHLTPEERAVATSLKRGEKLETFIRRQEGDSLSVGRAVVMMMTLGIFVPERAPEEVAQGGPENDPQRDLLLLAAIGAEDGRSLKVVALARQLEMMNHYELLRIPTRSTRIEIMKRVAELKSRFDPQTFPPIVREYVEAIRRRLDEAAGMLLDPVRRLEYDALVKRVEGRQLHLTMQQRITRRGMAEKNYRKGCELAAKKDFYGAIVLLKQAVDFAPDHAEAWFMLASCQERNPQWHREAVESFEQTLALNPNHVEALISLADLYKSQGLVARAEGLYEEVLQIDADNPQALSRLKRKPRKAEE